MAGLEAPSCYRIWLPRWLNAKESSCQCTRHPGLGGSPGEGNGNPLQYSCLENLMDRGIWQTLSINSVQFSCSVMSDSVTPWTAACQAPLSITNSWSLLKLMFIELVMPSNHLILCRPLLLLPSIFPSLRVFSNESVLRIR